MSKERMNGAELGRLGFLQVVGTVLGGALIGKKLLDFEEKVVVPVAEKVTKTPVGRAVVVEEFQACQENGTSEAKCNEQIMANTGINHFSAVVSAPVQEEIVFRWMPSLVSSILSRREDPWRDGLRGTGQLPISRNEIVTGVVTSTLFALAHNITPHGFSMKAIPLTQWISGGAYWCMQRMWGFPANWSAHAYHNWLLMKNIK